MNNPHQKNHLSRRNLLQIGTGVVSAGVAVGLGSNLLTPETATAKKIVTPDDALKALM